MIVFNISRRIANIGLALVHPRWRPIALMVVLGIINVIVGYLNVLTTRSNLAGVPPDVYLQHPDFDYWMIAASFCCVGLMPPFFTIVPISRLAWQRPRIDKQVDQALCSLGLKGRVYSKTIMLYQGVIDDRQIAIFVDARRPQRGVYMTPMPKGVTLSSNIQIRMRAEHRGDMSLLPETTQLMRLPPNVIKIPLDRSVLPGKTLLTLDEDWSNKLLANENVTAAMRRLAPEGDPSRHYSIEIGGLSVTLKTIFKNLQQTGDPLAQFVTAEHMQQVLADLRVLAEAAESLPEPAKPGPDDNLTRISASNPAAMNELPKLAVLLLVALGWGILNAISLFGH
jgi:hypothetical protein